MMKYIIIITHFLELVLVAVHDSDSQNEFLSIVVIEDTVQIVSEPFGETTTMTLGKSASLPFKLQNKSACKATYLH